ncbi:hypothetical protein FRB90_009126 [Tulasnella sp. 427]|nr:hypothetical protein FRB90_009126 [Tulasnella sp. 427]
MPQRAVLVTGASKGIGLCVARILLRNHKATVFAFSRTLTLELDQLLAEFPDRIIAVQGDVTSKDSIRRAVETVSEKSGLLDALVINAGTLGTIGKISSSSLQDWRDVFDVNLFSVVEVIQAALPALRKSELGKIVFVSSGAADRGYVGWGPYSASKAALNSLCRTVANEERDLVAVSIRPGAVDTGMQEKVRTEGANTMDAAELDKFNTLYSSGRLVKPEECGQVIAGLAVNATKDLSGKYFSWDDDALKQYRQ